MSVCDTDSTMRNEKAKEKTAREGLCPCDRSRHSVCSREGQGEKEQENSVCASVCDTDSTMRNEKAKEKTAKEKPPKNRAQTRARFLYRATGDLVLVGG